jgi:hypothetical protein
VGESWTRFAVTAVLRLKTEKRRQPLRSRRAIWSAVTSRSNRFGCPYYEELDADPIKHKLDLFLPKECKDFRLDLLPRSLGHGRPQFVRLVRQDFANGIGTVIIGYRLTPKVQHPGHIEDVARAFAWTHKDIGSMVGGRTRFLSPGNPPAAISRPCWRLTRRISRLMR